MQNILPLFTYKIINEFIFWIFTSKIFENVGLIYKPNMSKLIISYILFFFICIMPLKKRLVSSYLISVFFIFTIIPLLSLYWQQDRSTNYLIYSVISYLVLYSICNFPNQEKAYFLRISDLLKSINLTTLLAIIISLFLVMLILVYGLADFRALNLYNVYDVRGERSFSGIFGYIVNWLPYSLVPCLICLSLSKNQKVLFLYAVLIQFYLYLFTASKTTLFSIGLILFSYWIVKNNKPFKTYWAVMLTFVSVTSALIYVFFEELMPFAIFPVRLLTIPAFISNNHYDFFLVNEKLYFSENIIGSLLGIKSPYHEFSTYLVSSGSGNANTGILADGYDNGGFLVMIIYMVILGFILRYIDKIFIRNKYKDLEVFVGILTYTMLYLNDGTLTAVLLTGGLIINIFILVLYHSK